MTANQTTPTAPDDWQPSFSRWKDCGFYVTNVQRGDRAVGCVSNHFPDGKWRIVCDPRRGSALNAPGDYSFDTRDEAARAERDLSVLLNAEAAAA